VGVVVAVAVIVTVVVLCVVEILAERIRDERHEQPVREAGDHTCLHAPAEVVVEHRFSGR
jgi:hypothetical protein